MLYEKSENERTNRCVGWKEGGKVKGGTVLNSFDYNRNYLTKVSI